MSEENNNSSPALYSFLGFSLISLSGLCIWFKYTMMPWHDDPSLLCGPKVDVVRIGSEWSTIFGIAVSAPLFLCMPFCS